MEECKLTQVPCRKAIIEAVENSRNRQILQHMYSIVKLLQDADLNFKELNEEDRERYFYLWDFFLLDIKNLKAANSFIRALLR